jgi:hypothetical protein
MRHNATALAVNQMPTPWFSTVTTNLMTLESSTEVQVDMSDTASTPPAAESSMHDIAPTVPALTDDAGSSTAEDDTPSWITDTKHYFLTILAREKWAELVHLWIDIERQLGYSDGSVSPSYIVLKYSLTLSHRIGQTGSPQRNTLKKSSGGMGRGKSSV